MPSNRELEKIQHRIFGDRFKAGVGLKDPAYMPLFPHEAAEYLFGRKPWDKHNSAADLEAYVSSAPAIDQLPPADRSEQRYDDAARLAAKWILERLRVMPSEAKLAVTFWETMTSVYPRMVELSLSTAQQRWAQSAALRILDAYRAERKIN